ncbi:MAG: S-methyl-5-thioribose-1-phosphate isomerase [candidate division WOR-3 bacterium]|nr:MAG: S-methyl-5-thioribose-1-phosphate isomerase [candidate division WOR-3 bacterium]
MQAGSNIIDFKTIEYDHQRNVLTVLDQTRLPNEEVYLTLKTPEDVFEAIKSMNVRGAPLIGITAAYGLVLAGVQGDVQETMRAAELLASARPTAVNLTWALERMKRQISEEPGLHKRLLRAAREIEEIDKTACRKIGEHGATLIKNNASIMVHCNAGALATSGIGTALGIIYTARQQGKKISVYSCETRPLLQGARLTTWELTRQGVDTFAICDNMAASYMSNMDIVLVGADRIAANGDTANKVGTLGLAIIAKHFNIPFYVAAPLSSFDSHVASGINIPIEIRSPDELCSFKGQTIVAEAAQICNPAFDVTPANLISGIVTENGILTPPYGQAITTA